MLQTIHQRKSLVVTTIFTVVIIFLLFAVGLKYMDPPEEFGVTIAFGVSEAGSGEAQELDNVKTDPAPTEEISEAQEVEPVEAPVEEIIPTEEVITQDEIDAASIKKEKNKKEVPPVKEGVSEKKEQKLVEKPKPQPSNATKNALSNLFGPKSESSNTVSKGDDNVNGSKGSKEGDPLSDKYYGNTGLGGDGNYLLKGRRALSKPTNKPNCNEEGIVVVKIEVNKEGKVILAEPGIKGTTNSAPCLLEPAKKAALQTKWNPDGNAPFKQVGYIRYHFILSE